MAAPNKVRIERRDGEVYRPNHLSKDQGIRIQEGDRVVIDTPGGGGYGDPLARAPEQVLRDVARGYYTMEQAKALFGVVLLPPATGETAYRLDRQATEALRRPGLAAQ